MPVYRGWNAKILIDGTEVGRVQQVRVDIDHSLEAYFEAGTRNAQQIIEGPINITGSFKRAWIDTTYLSLISGTSSLSSFDLYIEVWNKPAGSSSSLAFGLYVYNCKLGKGSITVPQEGILTEDYTFIAKSIALA